MQGELVIRPVETMEQLSAFDAIVNACFGVSSDVPRTRNTPADYQTVNLRPLPGPCRGCARRDGDAESSCMGLR